MLINHFQVHGWVPIPGAFSEDEAAAMREVTWRALDAVGIRRDEDGEVVDVTLDELVERRPNG